MTVTPMDKTERASIFRNYAQVMANYAAARQTRDETACDRHFAEARRIRDRYFERLPRVCMAACPICAKPLYRLFDPFGLDGLWWSASPAWSEPPCCPHYVLLRGAVAFNGRPIRAGDAVVHPGPEVPYVIPRLLEMDDMVMTIGELPMDPGYTAYPLAYFARRRPPTSELTSVWARPTFEYKNAAGEGGWNYANDPWEFDLMPWAARGRLRWLKAGSGNAELSDDPPERCPYLLLTGVRQALEVQRDTVRKIGVPDGQPIFPID
jgi:hypothetical protein